MGFLSFSIFEKESSFIFLRFRILIHFQPVTPAFFLVCGTLLGYNVFMAFTPDDTRYEQASYRRCGRSGLKLPSLSLGLWHNFGDVDDFENARSMIHCAFDHGITHFDLANNYGPSPGSAERNFGKILAEDLTAYRDELIVSTKAGYRMWPGPYGEWGSRKNLLASLDQSLARMGLVLSPGSGDADQSLC